MMPSPQVRLAVPADEESLGELDRVSWSPLGDFPSTREGPRQPFFRTGSPDDVLVAEVEGRLAGYVRLRAATPLPESAHVVVVNGLVVHPDMRRRGLARTLLEAAEQLATERGMRKVSLRVLAHNTPARTLYAALGYEVEGLLAAEFQIDGTYVDDFILAKHLAAPGRVANGDGRTP